MTSKVWRIKIALVVPVSSRQDEQMNIVTQSRIPERQNTITKDAFITYGPWFGHYSTPRNFDWRHELAALTITRRANNNRAALDDSVDLIELIYDDLSFQFQESIRTSEVRVLDVTSPINQGDDRDEEVYANAAGFPIARFSSMFSLGNTTTLFAPELQVTHTIAEEKVRAALRWYVKGLTAQTDVDKFMFYWIAVEILCNYQGVKVKVVYTAPCGHDIPQCPKCKRSTEKHLTGEAIKRFMVEEFGVKPSDANTLWKVRQMFHGQNKLDRHGLKDFSDHVYLLRYVACHGLKRALSIPDDAPPFYELGAAQFGSVMSLSTRRSITEEDLVIREMDHEMFT